MLSHAGERGVRVHGQVHRIPHGERTSLPCGTMAFSCTFPDIEAQVQSDRVQMTLSVQQGDDDAETIYDEQLYADGDRMICLTDVDRLLQPYATKWLTFTLSCVIKEIYSSSVAGDQDSFECQIISCKANIVNLTASSLTTSLAIRICENIGLGEAHRQ